MNKFFASVLLTLLFVAVVLVAVLLVTLSFAGIGWVVHQAFGMGLLPSTAIAIVVGLAVIYIGLQIITLPEFEAEEDWDDDDWDDVLGDEWLEEYGEDWEDDDLADPEEEEEAV